MIRKDGYYISDGFPWVDWHVGHKFEGIIYKVLVFFDNNQLLRLSVDKIDDINIMDEISGSFPKDYYKDQGELLEIIINPNDPFSKKREFTILSPDILLDENLKEYHFVPTNTSVKL